MSPLSETAGLIPEDLIGLHQWLVRFWDYHADLASEPEQRAYCEDEAWRCTRIIETRQREKARALAQQEAA